MFKAGGKADGKRPQDAILEQVMVALGKLVFQRRLPPVHKSASHFFRLPSRPPSFRSRTFVYECEESKDNVGKSVQQNASFTWKNTQTRCALPELRHTL